MNSNEAPTLEHRLEQAERRLALLEWLLGRELFARSGGVPAGTMVIETAPRDPGAFYDGPEGHLLFPDGSRFDLPLRPKRDRILSKFKLDPPDRDRHPA